MAQGHLSPFGIGSQSSDPFVTLRNEMEQLFDNVLRGPAQSGGNRATVVAPRMDVSEDDNEIRITAEMPGATPDNVTVTIDDDILTIRGEREQERETSRKNYHMVERTVGVFQRSLRLPTPVDPEKVQARFDNGVLNITIPKTAAAQRSKRIEVQGGSRAQTSSDEAKGSAAAGEGETQAQRDTHH